MDRKKEGEIMNGGRAHLHNEWVNNRRVIDVYSTVGAN